MDEKIQETNHREWSDSNSAEKQQVDVTRTPNDSPSSPTKVTWTAKRMIAIASLCLAYVGAQIILYFVGGALSFISADLGTSVGSWLGTANTLAVAAICPFVGYMTDLLGRKWITVFGSFLLVLASILVATAQGFGQAIVGMTFGGIGAGICELTALAGIAEITPVRYRGVTLSIATFSIIPFIPYLIYINELQKNASWRWSLLIVGIWNFLGFVGIIFCYSPPPRPNPEGLTQMQILKRVDYVGGVLSIGGITLFLVGLQAGGYQFPWMTGQVLGPLIIGIIMMCAFPAWEIWGAKYPIVPHAIFKGQRVVALALVIVFVAGMSFYSILNFFPLLLMTFYNADPLTTGIRALGYPLAITIGACGINALISFTRGHIREMFVVMAVVMTAFSGSLAAATPENVTYALVMSTFAALGNGGVIVPALTIALYGCPDEYIGTTTALSLSVRFLGGSVGNTVFFNVFNTKLTEYLPARVAEYAINAGLPQSQAMEFVQAFVTSPTTAQASPEILAAAALGQRWAYSEAMKYVWYASAAFGAVAVVCCAALPNIRRFMTDRVAVQLH